MQDLIKRFGVISFTVTLGLLTITGCTTGTTDAQPGAPLATAPTASVEPTTTETTATPTPTSEPVEAGAVLTAEQITALPAGTSAFQLTDGTSIALVRSQPIPDAVTADIQVRAYAQFPVGPVNAPNGPDVGRQLHAFGDWMGEMQRAMGGMRVAIVIKSIHLASDEAQDHGRWAVLTGSTANLKSYPTRDEAIAAANATAAHLGDIAVVILDY